MAKNIRNSKKQKRHEKNKTEDNLIYYGLFLLMMITPLIISLNVSSYSSPIIDEIESLKFNTSDMFNHAKAIMLWSITFILMCLFTYKTVKNKDILITKYNYFAIALFFFLSVSLLFSPYKIGAFWGSPTYYEGALTYFCLIALFLIIVNLKLNEQRKIALFFSLAPFVVVNLILGLLNYFTINVINQGWMKGLIGIGSNTVSQDGYISSTLPNPNYISGASGFIFTLFFSLAIFHKSKKVKIYALVLAFFSFISVLTSFSESGFIVILVLLPIIIAIGIFLNKEQLKINLQLVTTLLLVSVVSLSLMANNNDLVWKNTVGMFINSEKTTKSEQSDNTNTTGPLADNVFSNSSVNKENEENNDQNLYNDIGIPEIPKAGVSSLNGRIYIWKKTFEIWEESPVFGYGLTTLRYYIDQDDAERISNLGANNVIIGKPHSLYLGWLYGGGIFVFLAFIGFFLTLALEFIRSIVNKNNDPILMGTGFAFVAYCIQGLVNDSTMGSSIIFWILLGILGNQLVNKRVN
ncbi:MAG: O-antigen polymerase [Bacillales bacterium]|jgi:hypothetical protein|nr:O-antigen polymerase [Bacillales bacterium]